MRWRPLPLKRRSLLETWRSWLQNSRSLNEPSKMKLKLSRRLLTSWNLSFKFFNMTWMRLGPNRRGTSTKVTTGKRARPSEVNILPTFTWRWTHPLLLNRMSFSSVYRRNTISVLVVFKSAQYVRKWRKQLRKKFLKRLLMNKLVIRPSFKLKLFNKRHPDLDLFWPFAVLYYVITLCCTFWRNFWCQNFFCLIYECAHYLIFLSCNIYLYQYVCLNVYFGYFYPSFSK